MKRLNSIFTVLIFIISLNASGQINQDCNGNIGLGGAPSGTKLKIYGGFFSNGGFFRSTKGGPGLNVESYSVHPYFDAIQIRPQSDNYGRLGSPGYAFSDIYYYVEHKMSDKRKKENIKNISGAINKVVKMQGVIYDLKRDNYLVDTIQFNSETIEKIDKKRKNKYGFLAQDMEQVLPDIVEHDDSTDMYSIEYSAILPVLVEAIKEQQVIIESLQSEIKELKKQSGNASKLKSATTTNINGDFESSSENTLYQNSPNPFNQSTTIEYYLNESTKSAMIYIYDMNGTQLNSIDLHQFGYGSININGGEYNAGMYIYALIADGQMIDTKQMILTD